MIHCIPFSQGKIRKIRDTSPISPTGLEWRRIEALFIALGTQVIEGSGSRVRFVLNDVVATFHRSYPAKEAKPYQVRDARTFLENAGVKL